MSISKVFWAGAASGALLAGSAFAAVWYASSQPQCALARAFDGACHATEQLSPVRGLRHAVDRLEAARTLAKDETDIRAGLPEDPTPDASEPAAPGTSVMSNVGDPPSIVIPEDGVPEAVPQFPTQAATPAAPQALGAPATMPRCEEDEAALHMPRLLVEEEPRACWMKCLLEKLTGVASSPVRGGEYEAEEMEDAGPECREDPHRHEQYPGCPYTGRGGQPGPQMPINQVPALKTLRQIFNPEPLRDWPATPGLETLELRPGDRQLDEYGPNSL